VVQSSPLFPRCFLSSFFLVCYHAFLSMEKHGLTGGIVVFCDTSYLSPGAFRGWGSRPSGSLEMLGFRCFADPAPFDPKRRPSLWKRLAAESDRRARVCEERWRGQGAGRLPPRRTPPERRKPGSSTPPSYPGGLSGSSSQALPSGFPGGGKRRWPFSLPRPSWRSLFPWATPALCLPR